MDSTSRRPQLESAAPPGVRDRDLRRRPLLVARQVRHHPSARLRRRRVGAARVSSLLVTFSNPHVRTAVGVMARAPSVSGKTRLAAAIPESRLLALKTAFLADTL